MGDSKVKLSIIVPVYNVSRYIEKCLDSLLCQDLSADEYEIIIVNDGSTDNSLDIARRYAEQYINFHVVSQENQGLSGARNTGIAAALGKYIQFVDSDDYLEPNVLKTLVDKMELENLDILRFNYQNVNENYEIYKPYTDPKLFVDYRDEVCDGLTFLAERLGYACYVVQFIIAAHLLKNNENLFKRGIYFEDTEWTPRIITQAQHVTSIDLIVYNYLLRSGSITNSVYTDKKRKVLEDKIFLISSLKQQMTDKADKRWYEGMISATAVSVICLAASDFYNNCDDIIQQLKNYKIFPLTTFHHIKTTSRKIRFINFSPKLFCFVLHSIRRLGRK